MDQTVTAADVLPDQDLVLKFESVGDNCELGLVQRLTGVEPLGLLRFAGAPLRQVVRALSSRFEDIADPNHIRIHEEHGEYMVKLTKYDFYYHAHVKVADMTADALHSQQCRTVRFLADKLIQDLENPSKILVFRQNEPVLATDLLDLRIALCAYGPNTLLWVQEACPGHPPGTVCVADESLLVGYVRRLAAREDVPNLDHQAWLSVLRRAYALCQMPARERMPAGLTAARAIARTDVRFGIEGNAKPCLGFGWSGPEAGYQWSVGERSQLTINNPGDADEYWLEMEVTPYVFPPLLPRQRLDVLVNGTLVRTIDPLLRGEIGFAVPGHLVRGRPTVAIVLDHPCAASPILVAGGRDDRRLAISFVRLSLICA